MFIRSIDLLTDNRNPLFFLPNYVKKIGLEKKLRNMEIPKGTEVAFALTFDVEYDFGSAGNKTTKCVGPFLDRITEILDKKRLLATFFVQGNLIGKYHEQLLRLQKKGHEIGLHGWAHEPWGEAWFIKEKVPSAKEREELLKRSLGEFEKNHLGKPLSFRAPNMAIGRDSFFLLEKYGFKVDSSAPSFRGVPPLITRIGKITEIPVSSSPIPSIRGLRALYYVLNTHNLKEAKNISVDIAKYQLSKHQKPFLVFLAHPWEFFNGGPWDYCGPQNYEMLIDFLDFPGKNISKVPAALSSLPSTLLR